MENNELTILNNTIEKNSKGIFSDKNEQKLFYKYAVEIYANNPNLKGLNFDKINACILQMFLRNADAANGEAYVVGYKDKNGKTVAQVQNGYKFAIKKLWETGELEELPLTFPIFEGELLSFNQTNRNVKFKIKEITNYQQFQVRKKLKRIGWISRFIMKNGLKIEKFFFEEEIEEHALKYSNGYQSAKKFGKLAKGIWVTNKFEMFQKTAFMKTYNLFLPKNSKMNQAIRDINALNSATYDNFEKNAKPIYYDNPQTIQKNEQVKKIIKIDFAEKSEINKIFKKGDGIDNFKMNIQKKWIEIRKNDGINDNPKSWYEMSKKELIIINEYVEKIIKNENITGEIKIEKKEN